MSQSKSKTNNVIPMSVKPIDDTDGDGHMSVKVEQSESVIRTNMSFHNINYTVQMEKSPFGACRGKTLKRVVTDTCGIMKPGLNAIMGPTGSGKSSLLDILAGRKDPAGLSGQVLIDGKPLPSNFKRISGYVVQQDIVLGTLTVRENLWFSANLRLPRSVSKKVKEKRIQEILYDLGLTGCADTKVGNELIRGISGGEKKRASIAIELITSPTVLFLDEPTTGLDASTANAVMLLLKKLGNRGRTIILSIHQPRYSIFRLFDSLTLLSLGRLVYHGPYDKVLPYFEELGYHCQEHNNPADFFLDVINGDSTALSNSIEYSNEEVATTAEENNSSLAEQLAEKFEKSDIYQENKRELAEIYDGYKASKKRTVRMLEDYATPFYYQFGILCKRAFKNVIRNPIASVGTLGINLIVGVVFGLLYYNVDNSPTTGTQNRFGVLFFIITNLMFGSISAIEVFVKERDIFVYVRLRNPTNVVPLPCYNALLLKINQSNHCSYVISLFEQVLYHSDQTLNVAIKYFIFFRHEYVSGYYRVISYFLSKLVADLIPMRTISPIIFCAVTYWMVGLKADAGSFFIFTLFVILTGYSATAIALFFSATFETFAVASIFISLTFVFSILFAGLLLNVETVLPWLAWIKYLSIAQYGFSGLCVNEFRGQNFTACLTASEGAIVLPNTTCTVTSITGESFLYDRLGIGSNNVLSDWDLWVNVVALSCICLGMFTLTYIQLRRIKTVT